MAGEAFDNREGKIWHNGKMLQWQDANLHVLSHGLHYGSTVFEGARAYNGKIFKLHEHTTRLFFSAKELGFEIPFTKEEVNQACQKVLKENKIVDGYLRPIAWRGSEMMGVSAQENRINLAVAAWPWPSYFSPEARTKGIRLQIAKWKRPSPETAPVHAKACGLYMICTLAKHTAENDGFDDALMLDYRSLIAEATGANIFFVMGDGRLHTPTPDCFLDGITRRTIIDIARSRNIEVIERQIVPEELSKATEVFLTGTAAEVTPVGQIEDYKYTVGDISQWMMDDYDNAVRGID
jgi:branched-chain amino acid aminotransferase